MKVSSEKPPQWILDGVKQWGVEWESDVIFTYGDLITTFKGHIPDDYYIHECHHTEQHKKMGKDNWWRRYFEDPQFRLEQELECYQKQYEWVCKHTKDRNTRFRALNQYATHLSAPMYGGVITKQEALRKIRQNVV